jgi:hypothetical protein
MAARTWPWEVAAHEAVVVIVSRRPVLRSQVATPHSRVAMALRTRAAAYSDPTQGSGDLALLTDGDHAPLACACSFSLRGGYDGERSSHGCVERETERVEGGRALDSEPS